MLSPCGDGAVSLSEPPRTPGAAWDWEEQAWSCGAAPAGAHRPSSRPALPLPPTGHRNLPQTRELGGADTTSPRDPQAVPTSLTPKRLFRDPRLPSSGVPELEAEGRAGPAGTLPLSPPWPHFAVSAVRLSPGSGCTLGRPSSNPQDQSWPPIPEWCPHSLSCGGAGPTQRPPGGSPPYTTPVSRPGTAEPSPLPPWPSPHWWALVTCCVRIGFGCVEEKSSMNGN